MRIWIDSNQDELTDALVPLLYRDLRDYNFDILEDDGEAEEDLRYRAALGLAKGWVSTIRQILARDLVEVVREFLTQRAEPVFRFRWIVE